MNEQNEQIKNLIQSGIAAIKSKDKPLARELLREAIDQEPTNAVAWFWLSAALDDPYEQEECLQHVLMLEPDNALAEKGLQIAQKRIVDQAFERGVKAAEAQDRGLAQQMLTDVVERDENNLEAWLWLSQVVETSEDQEVCFTNILALDPENEEVREKLELLTQTKEISTENPWLDDFDEIKSVEQVVAPTLAGDILGDDFREKYTTTIPEPGPEPVSRTAALWAKYDDNLGCPYCGNPTDLENRRCPSCNHTLWVSKHSAESRSTLLWILILMQAMSTVILTVIPLIILFVVAQTVGIFNFFNLVPAYLGLDSSISPELISAAFSSFPRIYFYLSWIPAILSLVFTVTLYLRWTPVYYLLLVSAFLGLAGSVVGLARLPSFAGSIFLWSLGILLSLATLVMVIKLESDFRKSRRRLYLQVDSDLKEGMAFIIRGKQYARKEMWALAAIHLRQGIALMPYVADAHLATAIACTHLKDYELAHAILENAHQIDPDNTRIQQAIEVINSETSDQSQKADTDTELSEIESDEGLTSSSMQDELTNEEEEQSQQFQSYQQTFTPDSDDSLSDLTGTSSIENDQD